MSQHYTKNTVQASAYCGPCGKFTPHRVCDGRIDCCLTCLEKREQESAARKAELKPLTQGELWGEKL